MMRTIQIALFYMLMTIASSVTAASEWDVDRLTDLQKQWTITFNEPVELQHIEENTIVIRDEHGDVVHTTLKQSTPYELIVDVGENMYDTEHTYTLTIAPFASTAGNVLNEAVTMMFTTASTFDVNPEFLPKIDATPLHTYENQALVTLSYDDGYKNWYTKALPLHAQYALPGTFNINTYRLDELDENFMSYSDVWVAHDRGMEIGAHTHDHARLDLSWFSEAEIRYQLEENIRMLRDLDIDVKTLAAPNSVYSNEVRSIAKDYFEGVRVFGSQLNTPDNYDPHWLKSFAVTNETTVEEMQQWINEAVATKSWLIIMLHNVVDEPIDGCANGEEECDELYDISTANLEELMAYIASFSREQLLPVNTYEGVQMTSNWSK
ncbi:MAG: polysaccharide deacetylase family protein [Caryophanon sp.]|nr:polysaccharide deacetylase family protein [Caryophanon sp.]